MPYFDTNDFYFSGHVGVTTIFTSEYLAMRWHKMAAFMVFLVIDSLIMCTLVRTHYVIDYSTAYAFARVLHRIGEKLSYYPDVKLCGYPREKRFALNYDPCPKCGWGNKAVLRVTTLEDVNLQKKLYAAQLQSARKQMMSTDNNNPGSGSLLVSDGDGEVEESNNNTNKFMPSINN